jgi:HTH-type transcriptional regulator/antitoxin HigA
VEKELDMSTAKSIEIPIRENPYAGKLYNRLIERFPLNIIESEETHKKAKDLFLNLLRHKKEPDTSAEVIQQINAYMGSLKLLITDYETRTFKFRKPSAVDMLKELMERHGLKQTDFEREIGKQPHVSRILNGERELTLEQIKALGKRFNVSPEIFL